MGCHWNLALVLAGCGRFGFDGAGTAGSDAVGADGDAGGDDGLPQIVGCPPGALLCDDFETADFRRWSFVKMQGATTAAATGERVHAGSYSLAATVPQSGGTTAIAEPTLQAQISTGTVAMRAWMSFAAPVSGYTALMTLGPQNGEFVTGGGDNNTRWVAVESDGIGFMDHYSTTTTPSLGQWDCV